METPAALPPDKIQSKSNPAASAFQVSRYSYYALGILTLVNFLNYIDRQILPSVAPLMAADLHLTDTEIGAMEAALLLSFTVLAPLFGRLGDRYSRTKLMASAAIIWSIATGLTGVIDYFPALPGSIHANLPLVHFTLELSGVAIVLCLVRAIVGVGESSYSTITPSLIADFFPPDRRATALGVFQAAIPMGFALGYVIGVVLAHFFGWRWAFMIVGLPGLVTAWFVWRLREPMRGASEHQQPNSNTQRNAEQSVAETKLVHESWLRTSWRILCTRDWLLSTAGYTALTFVLGAFGTWATILLVRDKGLTVTQAGITLGLVSLFAGAAGTFGGGWLADKLIVRNRNAYFLLCAASSALGIIPVFVVLSANNPWIFVPAIFLSVFFLFINNAPFHAILINSVPPLVRATAVALNIVIIHIMGDVISRFGVGVLSDSIQAGHLSFIVRFARLLGIEAERQHLTAALMVVPISLLLSSLLFLWGAASRKTVTV